MAGNAGIVLGLRGLGKARNAPQGPQGLHAPVAPGKHFVYIALVPHVKDQTVPPGVVDPVEGHREFHHPQVGGQMPSRLGHHIHDPVAQVLAELLRLPVADSI